MSELHPTLCTKTPLYVPSGLYMKQMTLDHLHQANAAAAFIVHQGNVVEYSGPT